MLLHSACAAKNIIQASRPDMARIKNVEPVQGDYFTYYVHSRSRPGEKWRVELEPFNWNGSCTCENFMFAHAPDLSRGVKPDGDSHRCYHIMAARSYFLEEVAPMIAKQLPKAPPSITGQIEKPKGKTYALDYNRTYEPKPAQISGPK